VVPPDSRFKPGPTNGKMQKDGLTYLKLSMRDNTIEMLMQSNNVAVKDPDPDGGWESLADYQSSDNQGPGRFLGMMTKNFKAPAAQALYLVGKVSDLQETNGTYAGSLSADAAKQMLMFRRGGGGNADVTNFVGTATFWVNNGELAKYEFHVTGSVTYNDNSLKTDRDTTVEIKDVGTTKIDVPADAKKLLP
jgi:hypothetical protein